MGQELLAQQMWEKKPRLYYKATNSAGLTVTRGSARKEYKYAVVTKQFNKWGGLPATFTPRLDLAERYLKYYNNGNSEYEIAEVELSSAKEHRLIKKQMSLRFLEQLTEGKNQQQQETEQSDDN